MIGTAEKEWRQLAPCFPRNQWLTVKRLSEIAGVSMTKEIHAIMYARNHQGVDECIQIYKGKRGQMLRRFVYRIR